MIARRVSTEVVENHIPTWAVYSDGRSLNQYYEDGVKRTPAEAEQAFRKGPVLKGRGEEAPVQIQMLTGMTTSNDNDGATLPQSSNAIIAANANNIDPALLPQLQAIATTHVDNGDGVVPSTDAGPDPEGPGV